MHTVSVCLADVRFRVVALGVGGATSWDWADGHTSNGAPEGEIQPCRSRQMYIRRREGEKDTAQDTRAKNAATGSRRDQAWRARSRTTGGQLWPVVICSAVTTPEARRWNQHGIETSGKGLWGLGLGLGLGLSLPHRETFTVQNSDYPMPISTST